MKEAKCSWRKVRRPCHVQIRGCHGHSKCETAIKEVLFDWWHSFCYCKNVAVSFVCEKHLVLQFLLWKALGAAISLDWSIWWTVLPIEWSIGSLGLTNCCPKVDFSSMAEVPLAVVEITPTFALSFNGSKPVAIPPSFIVKDWFVCCWPNALIKPTQFFLVD